MARQHIGTNGFELIVNAEEGLLLIGGERQRIHELAHLLRIAQQGHIRVEERADVLSRGRRHEAESDQNQNTNF